MKIDLQAWKPDTIPVTLKTIFGSKLSNRIIS